MVSVRDKIKDYKNSDIEKQIEATYLSALKNETFKKLVKSLNIGEKELMKYTSKLRKTTEELEKCRGCKNLFACKNEIDGFIYYPEILNDKLIFSYVACKHKKKNVDDNKYLDNIYSFGITEALTEAKMKDVHVDDKGRLPAIKWIKDFVLSYEKNKKGLYLYGSFGSGKTYLITAGLNELARKGTKYAVVYFPEFLRMLKGAFDSNFNEIFENIKEIEILFIDDIGAEATTAWGRDEVLGPILQYRMENKLTTFFTSNMNLKDLETHLSISKSSVDVLKAQRLIERIKMLAENVEMVSENKRG